MSMTPCSIPSGPFSDALSIDFSRVRIQERTELVSSLTQGSSVLHFGCCDHMALIAEKMRAGTWFHDTIAACADRAIGVDIDEEALDFCARARPKAEFVNWNVLHGGVPDLIAEASWDWCLLPETLEHLGDPVSFLSALRERLSEHCRYLLCTVPNATLLGNFVSAARGREVINSDHRHWYTPATILKVLGDAGFGDFEMAALRYGRKPGLKGVVKRRVEELSPLLASGLAVQASFHPS